jgi:SlyX protein
MNARALELIETKLAFLERANAELSDVVFRQQRTIDALREQIAAVAARMQSFGESEGGPLTVEDERPPHY